MVPIFQWWTDTWQDIFVSLDALCFLAVPRVKSDGRSLLYNKSAKSTCTLRGFSIFLGFASTTRSIFFIFFFFLQFLSLFAYQDLMILQTILISTIVLSCFFTFWTYIELIARCMSLNKRKVRSYGILFESEGNFFFYCSSFKCDLMSCLMQKTHLPILFMGPSTLYYVIVYIYIRTIYRKIFIAAHKFH